MTGWITSLPDVFWHFWRHFVDFVGVLALVELPSRTMWLVGEGLVLHNFNPFTSSGFQTWLIRGMVTDRYLHSFILSFLHFSLSFGKLYSNKPDNDKINVCFPCGKAVKMPLRIDGYFGEKLMQIPDKIQAINRISERETPKLGRLSRISEPSLKDWIRKRPFSKLLLASYLFIHSKKIQSSGHTCSLTAQFWPTKYSSTVAGMGIRNSIVFIAPGPGNSHKNILCISYYTRNLWCKRTWNRIFSCATNCVVCEL